MEHFIQAMRAAADKCEPYELRLMLDHIVDQAKEYYKAGALDVTEYGDIVNEYADTLLMASAVRGI